MKKLCVIFLVLMVVSMSVYAEGNKEETASTKSMVKGEVNAYIATNEDYCLVLKEEFEKAYPNMKFNYVFLSGGEIFTRLEAERNNPQADFIMGGGADSYIAATKKGLLMKYVPQYVKDHYPASAIGKDGTYVVHGNNILAICYDKAWYDANKVPYPTKWDDLLIPELKKNVIITNPGTSTTGYMMMSTLIANRGEEAGMQFMIDLDKNNIKSYEKGGSGPVNKVALGEAAAGMCYICFAIDLQEKGYTNLCVAVPEDGTGLEAGCAALAQGSKNEAAAKLFYDWYFSHVGELNLKAGIYELPSDPSAPVHKANELYAKQLNSGRNANVDYEWCAANKDRLVKEWDARISKN